MHTLWLREHNRIALYFQDSTFGWSDERIFQETRRIIAAEIQLITYNEYLPLLLGDRMLDEFNLRVQNTGYFDGYNPDTDATIRTEFSTAAFRFGHSLIQDTLKIVDRNFETYDRFSIVKLRDVFTSPHVIRDTSRGGPDGLLRGLLNATSQTPDWKVSKEVTGHLFEDQNTDGTIRKKGLDLISLNIQRGRDHGVPPYHEVRELCGVGRVSVASDLRNTHTRSNLDLLSRVYR